MRNYATAKFFLIDAACIEESGEDFALALRSFQMMFFCPYHRNPVRL